MQQLTYIPPAEIDLIFTASGCSLLELSNHKTVLLVFLRHFGCIFCREALKDLSIHRTDLQECNTELVLVHMETNAEADVYFSKYDLSGVHHIEDADQKLYKRFGLQRGNLSQLFGLKSLMRGRKASANMSLNSLIPKTDAFQMPGVFVIKKGVIKEQYIHQTVSDKPAYFDLVACCKDERV